MPASGSCCVSPGGVRRRVTALYVDGAQLLQGALVRQVARGQAGVGQRGAPLGPAAAAGARGAAAGHGRAAGRAGPQGGFQTVLLVYLLVHELVSLCATNRTSRGGSGK